jgi:hypothetical protein
VLQAVLGDEPLEVVETVAHRSIDRPKGKTLGGKVWWRDIEKKASFAFSKT